MAVEGDAMGIFSNPLFSGVGGIIIGFIIGLVVGFLIGFFRYYWRYRHEIHATFGSRK